jgi:heat shock protein HtpX
LNSISINHFRQKQHSTLNLIHTWLLVGGSIGLLAVCAYVFFGMSGIFYAAVFGGTSLYMASRISPQVVLKMYKAQKISAAQFPIGHQILDELVKRAGLEHHPELHIIPSNMLNAFAVGRKNNSAIAMTDRLVRMMTQRELAAIMAHEMAHIRNEDIKVMAIADMVSRFTSTVSTFGFIALFANLLSILFGGETNIPWLVVILLIAAPTIGGLLQLALSRTREFDADLGAVMLTGDPDGLASALLKLEKVQKQHWEGMVLPSGRVPNPSILRTHPKTEDRIERLMALKETPEKINDVAAGRIHRDTIIPEAIRKELPSKSSGVPKMQRKWGRGEGSKYSDYSSLLNTSEIKSLHKPKEADETACPDNLSEVNSKPRIRLTRGGVWW